MLSERKNYFKASNKTSIVHKNNTAKFEYYSPYNKIWSELEKEYRTNKESSILHSKYKELLDKITEQNNISAPDLFRVANVLYYGKTGTIDNDKAYDYINLAIRSLEHNDSKSLAYYKRLMAKILIGQDRYLEAKTVLEDNINKKDGHSAYMFAELLLDKKIPNDNNEGKAYKYLELAAELGNKKAIAHLRKNIIISKKYGAYLCNPDKDLPVKIRNLINGRTREIEEEIEKYLKSSTNSIGG